MNDDLISRKALIAEYDRVHIGPPGGARKRMEDAPAVDAKPVVHGRWEEVYTCNDEWLWGYRCNQCNVEHCRKDNYCPNCGAKMDGDSHENL